MELKRNAANEIVAIELDGSVDPHFHGRNPKGDGDGRMEMTMASAAHEHEVLVLIGNTSPPLRTQADVDAYLPKAQAAFPKSTDIDLYAAPLLTDQTTPEMVREMRQAEPRTVACLKGFMAGVSNDGGHSVSDVRKLGPVLQAAHDDSVDAPPLAVDWHMERKRNANGAIIEMRNREWYAIDNDFRRVLEVDPEGSHAVKHVSDGRTIDLLEKLREQGFDVYGEFSPHYFVRTHEDLYEGPGGGTAFNAHDLCWPIFKNSVSQYVLQKAALLGKPYYFFGSDCAWHVDDCTRAAGVKITRDGSVCGGTAILPAVSKSIVIDLFIRNGKEAHLNGFLSGNARRRLRLPPARTKVRYCREDWRVPDVFTGEGPGGPIKVRPFMRGETCHWKRVA